VGGDSLVNGRDWLPHKIDFISEKIDDVFFQAETIIEKMIATMAINVSSSVDEKNVMNKSRSYHGRH
jgi:hypothetical protein